MTDSTTLFVLTASPIILAFHFIKNTRSDKGWKSVGEMAVMAFCLGLAILAALGLWLAFPSKFP